MRANSNAGSDTWHPYNQITANMTADSIHPRSIHTNNQTQETSRLRQSQTIGKLMQVTNNIKKIKQQNWLPPTLKFNTMPERNHLSTLKFQLWIYENNKTEMHCRNTTLTQIFKWQLCLLTDELCNSRIAFWTNEAGVSNRPSAILIGIESYGGK